MHVVVVIYLATWILGLLLTLCKERYYYPKLGKAQKNAFSILVAKTVERNGCASRLF